MKVSFVLAVAGIGVAVGIYTSGGLGPALRGLGDLAAAFTPVKTIRVPNPLD